MQTITAWGYFAAWRILRWIPERFVYSLAYRISDYLTERNSKSVQRLRSNLARTQPTMNTVDLDALAYQGMRSAARYLCDTFRLQDWSLKKIQESVTVKNEYLILDAVRSGTGAIITTAHAGNYDHAAAYFCSKGARIVTVAEHLKPEALFKRFFAYRASFGMDSLPLDGHVMPILEQRLRDGWVVALAADRDLSRSGIDVRFFNGPARMPAGPAVLALKTGVPLICAMVSYTPTGIHIDLELVSIPSDGSESEKIRNVIQSSADLFAKGILARPQDWHMMQRIWTDGDFKERS